MNFFWILHKFFLNYIIGVFIINPKKCNLCYKGAIYTNDNNSAINPILSKCNNYKYKYELYLSKGTIFEFYNKIPESILYNI